MSFSEGELNWFCFINGEKHIFLKHGIKFMAKVGFRVEAGKLKRDN